MVRTAKINRSMTQKALREQLTGVDFSEALPTAVARLFRFTHRANEGKALWANSHNVWLGRTTFVHWSLNQEFDIPWIVAKAKNAPRNREDLNQRVEEELLTYFAQRLTELPKRATGNWLPLP